MNVTYLCRPSVVYLCTYLCLFIVFYLCFHMLFCQQVNPLDNPSLNPQAVVREHAGSHTLFLQHVSVVFNVTSPRAASKNQLQFAVGF